MDKIQAKTYKNRGDLERFICTTYGRTVDKKDAELVGKMVELEALGVSHGSSLWGVNVVASDYKPTDVVPVKRGKRQRSAINGVTI